MVSYRYVATIAKNFCALLDSIVSYRVEGRSTTMLAGQQKVNGQKVHHGTTMATGNYMV